MKDDKSLLAKYGAELLSASNTFGCKNECVFQQDVKKGRLPVDYCRE